jgi:hypothetical protein
VPEISTVAAALVQSCTTPGMRFATPMKLATKTEVGNGKISCGVPICSTRPSFMTAIPVRHRERLFLVVGP